MEKDLKREVSIAILRALFKKKMTQKQLADKLGVSPAMISRWVKGDCNLTLDTIQKIERATDEYLIGIML